MNFNLFNEISTSVFNSLNIQRPESVQNIQNIQNVDTETTSTEVSDIPTFSDVLNEFIDSTENLDEEIVNAIASAAETYNIDPNLIRAVIMTESSNNPNAVSSAGAMGLMQLMPRTAESLGVTDPFDISQNIHGGTRYLRQMLDRFDGDLELALAAYNAGASNVERFGGVPPFRETQNYIPRVQRHKQNYLIEQYRNNSNNS